ncbi:hypothetical protein BDN70DRAFT_517808 [Pholiota conissans]|uniref:Pentatricopeptide repeat-containing protein n=1 Tax=Pholiota conissans TaxID=109636 RepID=A0A9P5Z7H4_9AGAR|nr:hypothetical protein BDN70DRAFT_517808 [Pholiota conissans]
MPGEQLRVLPIARSRAGHARLFSTSCSLADTRPLGTRHYVESFCRENQSPVWALLDTLKSPAGRLRIEAALIESRISVEEFTTWAPAIIHSDIEKAVAKLEQLGYPISEESKESPSNPIPSWVILYLVIYKVRTTAHAEGPLVNLVFYHLDSAPPEIQGPLLVLTAYRLARHNLLIPLRRVVEAFLNTPLSDQENEFNLFLQALSSAPFRSVEGANNVVSILKAMEARQLKLRSQTYQSLLNDRFVTLQLTKYLHAKMVQEGFVPSAAHLESFLRVFSKNGAIHEARKYFTAIHAISQDAPLTADSSADPRFRANTLMLNAHEDKASAFAFLRRLAQLSAPSDAAIASPKAQRREVRFLTRTKDDVYDQTAALHVAANDLSTSTHKLIQAFLKMSAKPTIATHTVLIRGLLFRKQFQKAEVFWTKLAKSSLVMDKEALTAGVQTFIRNGKPHVAFQTLEKYSLKPGQEPHIRLPDLSPPVKITTVSMNEYLVSFKRISRPDIVFRLWDYMDVLYDVRPNAVTLSILLQSARLATTLDDSLSGAIAQFKLYNPLSRRDSSPPSNEIDNGTTSSSRAKARALAVRAITDAIGTPQHGLRAYGASIWRRQLPLDFARLAFLRALFGMDPTRRLDGVQSPAAAVRASYDGDASASALGLASLRPRPFVFTPPADLRPPPGGGDSYYPSVVVTNANCFNYITLLGVGGRAAEIPLVLAWMRELGLQPSESTLAVALVFWAEVSVQAPLVERWNGGPGRNEYAKLVEWIADWVGKKRVPGERTLQKWRGVVSSMRKPAR